MNRFYYYGCMLILAALLAIHLQPVSPAGPNRQPQIAAGNGTVAMVFGSGDTIWLARSEDSGRTFGVPAKVASLPKLMLGRHRGPRVVIAGNAIVVSAIGSEQGDLTAWRSTDSGRTWSQGKPINDVPKAAREGLHAMAGDAQGHLAAVWLDDRIGPKGKRLWGAFSNDAGATWSKNVMLYESPGGTICECCHPSLAALGAGDFVVMWRNALQGSRDMYTMRLSDGRPVSQPERQGVGTWKLEACPMDGGGLTVVNGKISSAWRREKDVYFVDAGKPEMKLGPGQDVAIGSNNQGTYVAWSTPQGIMVNLPRATSPSHLSNAGAFPSMAVMPDGAMLVVWEENGSIGIARL